MENVYEWGHLPNAIHIDRILSSMKANPVEWAAARWASTDTNAYQLASGDVFDAARDVVGATVLNTVLIATYKTTHNGASYMPAVGTMLALIAYEDSAHLLDSTPEEIRLLDALGHPYAVVMLGATTAFANINTVTSA